MRKVAKLFAVETIEEVAIFAESLNVPRPPFELPRFALILFDFLAGLTNIVALSRARGTLRTHPVRYGVEVAMTGCLENSVSPLLLLALRKK
jgi:hypothetical protein